MVYAEDSRAGLKAIIAIHNTALGPSCGGIRLLPYGSRDEAMTDVLRLSRGMSYKSALAGINFGGGKSVIIADPAKKSKELFHAFAEFVNSFGGKYIAAKDMNIDSNDLRQVSEKSKHVLGIEGVPGSSGDPSPVTARGIFRALEATVESFSGARNLNGVNVAIEGIGHVGYAVAQAIHKAGGKLWVCDINQASVRRAQDELGATAVPLDAIYNVACDVFSPSARGATLNATTIPRLRCKAIVGCANNQLATEKDGFQLHERGIIYAPDYVVNAGGIINIFVEYGGYDSTKAMKMADGIYSTVKEILERARTQKTAPFVVADKLAEERLYGKRA